MVDLSIVMLVYQRVGSHSAWYFVVSNIRVPRVPWSVWWMMGEPAKKKSFENQFFLNAGDHIPDGKHPMIYRAITPITMVYR